MDGTGKGNGLWKKASLHLNRIAMVSCIAKGRARGSGRTWLGMARNGTGIFNDIRETIERMYD